MKKIIISALVFSVVIGTGITGYAASSRGGQLLRPCTFWCQEAGTCVFDEAVSAGKRVLAYQEARAAEKKAAAEDTAGSGSADVKAEAVSKAADTVSVNTASGEAVAAPVENTVVPSAAETSAAAAQALCPHGYCIGQGLCPYSDCPNGGYCVNDGYQYQGGYGNGWGETYVDDSNYGTQTSDYTCYQGGGQGYGYQGGYGQGYGYQGGCGQGYGQGNGCGHHQGRHH